MLTWNNRYITGVDVIDDEHKDLISSFNILSELVKNKDGHIYYMEVIGFLRTYVEDHFNHEERIMLIYEYPNYSEHKKIHDDFKNMVNKWGATFDLSASKDINVRILMTTVEKWFFIHLNETDANLAEYLRNQTK